MVNLADGRITTVQINCSLPPNPIGRTIAMNLAPFADNPDAEMDELALKITATPELPEGRAEGTSA